MANDELLSIDLSKLLRYKCQKYGINQDTEGFSNILDVARKLGRSVEDIVDVSTTSFKRGQARFEIQTFNGVQIIRSTRKRQDQPRPEHFRDRRGMGAPGQDQQALTDLEARAQASRQLPVDMVTAWNALPNRSQPGPLAPPDLNRAAPLPAQLDSSVAATSPPPPLHAPASQRQSHAVQPQLPPTQPPPPACDPPGWDPLSDPATVSTPAVPSQPQPEGSHIKELFVRLRSFEAAQADTDARMQEKDAMIASLKDANESQAQMIIILQKRVEQLSEEKGCVELMDQEVQASAVANACEPEEMSQSSASSATSSGIATVETPVTTAGYASELFGVAAVKQSHVFGGNVESPAPWHTNQQIEEAALHIPVPDDALPPVAVTCTFELFGGAAACTYQATCYVVQGDFDGPNDFGEGYATVQLGDKVKKLKHADADDAWWFVQLLVGKEGAVLDHTPPAWMPKDYLIEA